MAEIDVAKRAYDIFISRGLQPHQAAAMVGQMMAESGGNPTIQETKADGTPGPGYGAFQWTDKDRRAGLDAYAKDRPWIDPKSLEGQIDYAMHELDTTEKGAGNQLYAAKSYPDAVNAATGFERPQGYTPDNPQGAHNYAGRYNYGATLAGVPQIAAPPPPMGGSQQVNGGLLSPMGDYAQSAVGSMPTTAGQLAADDKVSGAGAAAAAGGTSPWAEASKSLMSISKDVMKPLPGVQYQQLRENANEPQKLAQMPNFAQPGGDQDSFAQQLAQQRLAMFRKRPGGL